MEYFPYGYEEYEEKYGKELKAPVTEEALRLNPGSTNQEQSEKKAEKETAKNYYNPGKEKAKRERRIARLEELLEECDEKIARLKEELSKPEYASDYVKLGELQQEIDQLEEQSLAYMEEWSQLTEAMETN